MESLSSSSLTRDSSFSSLCDGVLRVAKAWIFRPGEVAAKLGDSCVRGFEVNKAAALLVTPWEYVLQ